MKASIQVKRETGMISPMLYGHFIEHFHRQIYGGLFDPDSPLADGQGFRTDVMEAMRKIKVPVLRWPGGCFVSSYHWKEGVGQERIPSYDKAWRVEEPNTFGTDEFIAFCRQVGCEPYFCTNAGTGTAEEMADWVEYCNLENEGRYAKWRITNGHEKPYGVKYWSIGNENYGSWEMGAKSAEEWARLVTESAKMMKRVDPSIQLSAAALTDLSWNSALLNACGGQLDWISIHRYWDPLFQINEPADYDQVMACTEGLSRPVEEVRGLLTAMGLEKKVKIAFDEWNLRGWHHPNIHTAKQAPRKEDYLPARDENDNNSTYTMADAVFSACFLNMCVRESDIVGMANFAPVVNTRGCIYAHKTGIVLRPTYYVFSLYANLMSGTAVDVWCEDIPKALRKDKMGRAREIILVDVAAALRDDGTAVVSAVNKDGEQERELTLHFTGMPSQVKMSMHVLNGPSKDSYNDVGLEGVGVKTSGWISFEGAPVLRLEPHSVTLIELKWQ